MNQDMHHSFEDYRLEQPHLTVNGLEIAAFVLSILGFFTCGVLSVISLLLSIVSMRSNRNGLNIAALTLSIIGMVPLVLLISAVSYYKIEEAKRLNAIEAEIQAEILANTELAESRFEDDWLKHDSEAQLYVGSHYLIHGALPETLEEAGYQVNDYYGPSEVEYTKTGEKSYTLTFNREAMIDYDTYKTISLSHSLTRTLDLTAVKEEFEARKKESEVVMMQIKEEIASDFLGDRYVSTWRHEKDAWENEIDVENPSNGVYHIISFGPNAKRDSDTKPNDDHVITLAFSPEHIQFRALSGDVRKNLDQWIDTALWFNDGDLEINDPWGSSLYLRHHHEDEFHVLSAGPDQKWDTNLSSERTLEVVGDDLAFTYRVRYSKYKKYIRVTKIIDYAIQLHQADPSLSEEQINTILNQQVSNLISEDKSRVEIDATKRTLQVTYFVRTDVTYEDNAFKNSVVGVLAIPLVVISAAEVVQGEEPIIAKIYKEEDDIYNTLTIPMNKEISAVNIKEFNKMFPEYRTD